LKLRIDDLEINYLVQGSGDYVFLLHGWGAGLESFAQIAPVIAEKYTVVSLDLPGFGGSEEPPDVWGVSEYAACVVRFIEHFQCDKVILLGHSFGGRLIIKLSSRKDLPFSISKIILVDSAGILPRRSWKYRLRVFAYKAGKRFLGTAPVAKVFPDALGRFRKAMGSSDYSQASEKMRAVLVKTVNEDLEPLLKNISAQTLLIWGEDDTATPLSDGQRMEKCITGAGTDAGLVTLKAAGHFSFLDQPYVFSEVIRSFLGIGA